MILVQSIFLLKTKGDEIDELDLPSGNDSSYMQGSTSFDFNLTNKNIVNGVQIKEKAKQLKPNEQGSLKMKNNSS